MVNKVILLGRLGVDPELRYTPNQTPVCSFKLATSDRRKGSDGQWSEHTEWHNIVTFGKTAENCAQYLKKGRQAYIDGRIQTRKYQGEDGKDKYWTEIIANTVQFVGGGKSDGANDQYAGSGMDSSSVNTYSGTSTGGSIGESVSFEDDDIPF
ncbi:MAG TPA: single-stranded DNA-binding protein [Oligoflexia bacterium]|nr:single-stranded DNA-binding protein [Oligoflexia bacterium]HMP47749.1 single-stranded DNA-binding protein [Oligoflexia bacterium]